MHGKEILTLLIYRKNSTDFQSETDSLKIKYINEIKEQQIQNGTWQNMTRIEKDKELDYWRNHFDHSNDAKGWKYNDIIGYISINAGSHKIKCYYWFVNFKRIDRRSIRKVFSYEGKIIDFDVFRNDTSTSIAQKLSNRLRDIYNKKPFKKYYIDIEHFDYISNYIDWVSVSIN